MILNVNTAQQFVIFYNETKDVKFSFQTAYKLNKLFRNIQSELEFVNQQMQEILNTYAEQDANGEFIYTNNGQSIKIQSSKVDECQEKLKSLNQLNITIDDIFFELEDFNNLEFTPSQIEGIVTFIK